MSLPSPTPLYLPSFDFIRESDRNMYQKTYQAITVADGWDFMKNYEINKKSTTNIKLQQIESEVFYYFPEHSGTSYHCVMHHMSQIALDGIDEFAKHYKTK